MTGVARSEGGNYKFMRTLRRGVQKYKTTLHEDNIKPRPIIRKLMKLTELICCRMILVWVLVNTVMSTSFQKELRMSLRTERLLPFQERFWFVVHYVTLPETCCHLSVFRLPLRRGVFALLRCYSVWIDTWLPTFRDTT